MVEQDHRAVKRVTRPMLGFKSFRADANVFAGTQLMHMIRKGQFVIDGVAAISFADQFHALARQFRPA
nr:DDE-type integrase/transposase/recombinase [Massilia sp. 9096]